ncbi:TPA: hypothetical protein DHW58_00895 [Patescibacteria group bacterium]|nr:hypothetical protein [Patescibacteria group bacterium]
MRTYLMMRQIAYILTVIWLGALVQPVLAVDALAASVVSVSPALALKAGATGGFEIAVKNTGTTAWANAGANPLKLGAIRPQDHASRFYDTSWLSPNRAATMQETTVAAGEIAHFSVTVMANGSGLTTEHFGLVVEGVAWLPRVDIPLTINVQPAVFAAKLVQLAPTNVSLKTGETASIDVTFQNTGDTAWQNMGGAAVKVGTASPFDRKSALYNSTWLSANRVVSAGVVVQPGETGTFSFTVQAPNKTGNFHEEFGLVAEGVAWMTAKFGLDMTVVPAVYDAKWSQQSPGPVSVAPGDTTQLWVEFQNIGNTTWLASGPTAAKLGTARQLDRVSVFRDPSWLSNNRVGNVTPDQVRPGETGRFTFTIKAPDKIGQYREYFRPVVEGVAWLPDVGLYWDIHVDEELVIASPIRVGLTSTTGTITVQGNMAIRRGSDKGLIRKVYGESVNITALSYGYRLSTGEEVKDYLRIVPMNKSVVSVSTDGIGLYNTFRGIVEIRRSNLSGNVWAVNTLELEDYLKGIAEVPDNWPVESQKAQMVAARTFAAKKRLAPRADIFDLYDDTRDQVYYGYNYEVQKPNLAAAAEATKGLVIKYNNEPISAYFFSDSGGATENVENVWGRGNPAAAIAYLKGVPDPYAKPIDWSATLTQDYLQGRFDNQLGIAANGSEIIDKIEVAERFPSGRARTVNFTLRSGRVVPVPFYDFDYLTNNNDIKSMNFNVATVGYVDTPDFMFTGQGWGHGVGLPQWGARRMAEAGKNFQEILTYYYTGVLVSAL